MAAIEKHTSGFEQSVASGNIAAASKALTDASVPAGARDSRDEKNLLTNAAILFSMVGFQAGLKHTEQPMSGKGFADQIQAIATKNPGIMANFGGEANFRETLQNISKLDATFASKGGIYFHLGSSPAETAEAFTKSMSNSIERPDGPACPRSLPIIWTPLAFLQTTRITRRHCLWRRAQNWSTPLFRDTTIRTTMRM